MKPFITIIIAVALSLIAGSFLLNKDGDNSTTTETAYERVMKTKTLRCGYVPTPTFITKDPVTGKMDGILYEILEEIGRHLRLKIEYTYETGYGNYMEDLNLGRFDVMCATLWADYGRIKGSLLLTPELYSSVYAIARTDDIRFNSLAAANSPQFIVTGIDGDITMTLAENVFPKSKKLALPNNADSTLLFENVVSGKADISFSDLGMFKDYDKKNPNKLKILTNNPAWVFGERMAVKNGEFQLKYILDTAIEELVNSGKIVEIIKRHPETSATAPLKQTIN